MIDFTLGLLAGAMWYHIVYFVIFAVAFGFSIYEEGAFWLTIIALIGTFMFADSFETVLNYWYYVPIYIIIGISWSVFKHTVVAKEVISDVFKSLYPRLNYAEVGSDNFERDKSMINDRVESRLRTRSSIDTRLYWTLLFPISMLGYVFGDMLRDLISKLGIIYSSITKKLIQSQFDSIEYPKVS